LTRIATMLIRNASSRKGAAGNCSSKGASRAASRGCYSYRRQAHRRGWMIHLRDAAVRENRGS
jgi:hypothetical protein